MWTNKHHIMSRVAKQHRVVFVNFRQQNPLNIVRTARRNDPATRVTLGKKVQAPEDAARYAVAIGLGIEEK